MSGGRVDESNTCFYLPYVALKSFRAKQPKNVLFLFALNIKYKISALFFVFVFNFEPLPNSCKIAFLIFFSIY